MVRDVVPDVFALKLSLFDLVIRRFVKNSFEPIDETVDLSPISALLALLVVPWIEERLALALVLFRELIGTYGLENGLCLGEISNHRQP